MALAKNVAYLRLLIKPCQLNFYSCISKFEFCDLFSGWVFCFCAMRPRIFNAGHCEIKIDANLLLLGYCFSSFVLMTIIGRFVVKTLIFEISYFLSFWQSINFTCKPVQHRSIVWHRCVCISSNRCTSVIAKFLFTFFHMSCHDLRLNEAFKVIKKILWITLQLISLERFVTAGGLSLKKGLFWHQL